MVSIPALGAGGRQFESGYPDITNMLLSSNWLGHYSFTVEISGSSPVWSTKNKKNREVAQLVRARIWILVKESNSNVLFYALGCRGRGFESHPPGKNKTNNKFTLVV